MCHRIVIGSITMPGGDACVEWCPLVLPLAMQCTSYNYLEAMRYHTDRQCWGIKAKVLYEGNDSDVECDPNDVLEFPLMLRPDTRWKPDSYVGSGHRHLFRKVLVQLPDGTTIDTLLSYQLIYAVQICRMWIETSIIPRNDYMEYPRILGTARANMGTESEEHRLFRVIYNIAYRAMMPTIRQIITIPESDATLHTAVEKVKAEKEFSHGEAFSITVIDGGGTNRLSSKAHANGTTMVVDIEARLSFPTSLRDFYLRMGVEAASGHVYYVGDEKPYPLDVSNRHM